MKKAEQRRVTTSMINQQRHPSGDITTLLAIMEKLRDPVSGCPWDLAQDFQSIVPFTIEEAFEVADAIEGKDLDSLPDELGDLLFQVVFYCQLGKEQGLFDFSIVIERISAKLTRRHPHVFNVDMNVLGKNDLGNNELGSNELGNKDLDNSVLSNNDLGNDVDNQAHGQSLSTQALKQAWEAAKAQERADKQLYSVLDDIPKGLPALSRALKIQTRVAKVGFDWAELEPVVAKIHEEIDEVLVEARLLDSDPAQYFPKVQDEMGDLLFAVVNLARHLGVDAEQALRQGNNKFEQRFRGVEALAKDSGKTMEEHSLAELDGYWDQVKARLKASQG
jgi:ATP diphosphatase